MENENLTKQSVLITYMYPMRMIHKEDEIISFTLDELNHCTYNHGLLCRIIGNITNEYNGKSIEYLVCGDGAFCVNDSCCNLNQNDLLLHFNDLFCKIHFGGINVEAIDSKDLTDGSFHEEKMIWPVNFGHSVNSNMHGRLRMKLANSMETIFLDGAAKDGKTINQLIAALETGNLIFSKLHNLSTYYLLTGITEYSYENWSSAVANLWIVVEQITDYLWNEKFLSNSNLQPDIPGRISSMKQDNRTFSASVKQEILYQTKLLPENTFKNIFSVRKARNKLVHEGKMIEEKEATLLYKSVHELISIASGHDI